MEKIKPLLRFSRQAKTYIGSDNKKYHSYRFKAFNRLLTAISKKRLKIFDFGCGTADNIITLLKSGHNLFGCDPAPEMIKIGRLSLRNAGFDPNIIHLGDVSVLKHEAAKRYDVVMAQDVLPYLTDKEEAEFFREARRILKDRGFLIVSFINPWVDLITFNRYTAEFWDENIISVLTKNRAEKSDLLKILKSHFTYPDIPKRIGDRCSEKDMLIQRKRIDPISCQRVLEKKGFEVDGIEFTHYFPMPPQFMENSRKYSKYIYKFEDLMRGNALSYVFASIYYLRLRPI